MAETAGDEGQTSAVAKAAVAAARVLVVDDIEENRDLLLRRLGRLGISHMEEAENGQQALARIEQENFDLVLLDIMMPVMTGYEVLQRLNASGRIHTLPVIVISALSEVDDIARCIEEGAEDFLLKPFNRTLLRARILSCLEKKALRDRTRQELQRKRAELAEARVLQLALVPPPAQRATALGLLALDPLLDPAKEVGGDMVDHFALGERWHVLIVGDVSDKGAGAALMMARSCAIFRSLAARQDAPQLFASPALATAEANRMLAANNAGCMFVTLLLACVDLQAGTLAYVRAGHVPPFLRQADGSIERLDHAGGLPLGVMEDAVYAQASVPLHAGACLLIVTDGVTEAMDPQARMFDDAGAERWLQAPACEPPQSADLLAAVRRHEAGAAPSDDVGILLLRLEAQLQPRFRGQVLLDTWLHPLPQAVSTLVEQVLELLQAQGVGMHSAHHAGLVLDELLTNLGMHAGSTDCRVWVALSATAVEIALEDHAAPFDPRQLPPADTAADIDSRGIGGLGVHLVLQLAQEFDYRSVPGRNLTTLSLARRE